MKRMICIILAALFLLAPMAALPVFAADDGTNEALEAEGYIGISTEEELKTVASNFYLKNDIVFTSGIGDPRKDITIDGNGHTVFFNGGISIFSQVENLTVQNLNLEGNVVLSDGAYGKNAPINYGPLAISMTGSATIRNVNSTVNITIKDGGFSGAVGGIIGNSDAKPYIFENLSYEGSINTGKTVNPKSTYSRVSVGGIAGYIGHEAEVKNVAVNADIVVGNDTIFAVGGLFGNLGRAEIKNCSFKGSLRVNGKPTDNCGIGGIVGFSVSGFNVSGVVNEGDIQVEGDAAKATAGGIIGVLKTQGANRSFTRVINRGNISGASAAGGIVGTFDFAPLSSCLDFTLVKNEGDITAQSSAGGILGKYDDAGNEKYTIKLYQVYNAGKISVAGPNAEMAGGMIGVANNYSQDKYLVVSAEEVYNTGELTGKQVAPMLHKYTRTSFNVIKDVYYSNDFAEGAISDNQGQKLDRESIELRVNKLNFKYVDTEALNAAIMKFDKLHKDNYSHVSWITAEKLVNEARNIIMFPTSIYQQTVDATTEAVEDAIASLEKVSLPAAELEKYNKLLEECKALNKENYSAETWEKFSEALDIAERSQMAYDMRIAYKKLLDAKEKLEHIETTPHATTPNGEDLGSAWNEFLAHQSDSAPSSSEGNDCGVMIGVGGVILFAVVAVGVGIIFKSKND